MFRITKYPPITGLGAMLLLACWAPASRAQYPPGYYPGGFYPGAAGGYMYGKAEVMNSYGNLMQQQEQARLQREQVNQAKLDTKKKTLDWLNYERANTPTYTDKQLKIKQQQLQRVMNKPAEAEVTSGKAQNIILPYLQSLADRGIAGPPVTLNQKQMQQINVTAVTSGNTSLGLLRQGEHMEWPLVLRGPTQQKLAALLPKATEAAVKGTLDFKLYKQVTSGVEQLNKELRKHLASDDIDGSVYLSGRRFLDSLEGAVKELQKPGAGKFLNGTYAARGRTVQELVENMSKEGLKFGPAIPGGEQAYFSLHRAMVSYAAGAENGPGFRVAAAPPSYGGVKGGPR
jgi:hypothetical protein